jgi:hypothetical protein
MNESAWHLSRAMPATVPPTVTQNINFTMCLSGYNVFEISHRGNIGGGALSGTSHETGKVIDEIAKRATRAWGELKKTRDFNLWWKVGEALQALQQEAMNEAGITARSNSRPAGIVFNRAMGELLRQYKLSDIDKGDRSRLLQMMQFRAEITEWHQGLPDSQRVRFNHPSTVWRHVRSLPSDPPPAAVQSDRDPPFRWQGAA